MMILKLTITPFWCFLLDWVTVSSSEGGRESWLFRDLICYECSGSDCQARGYRYPVRHLVVGCQTCYKEWDAAHEQGTRECFYPETLKEHQTGDLDPNTTTVTTSDEDRCGVIERDQVVYNYCFCHTDYCNSSPRTTATTLSLLCCGVSLAYLGQTARLKRFDT